MTRKQSRSHLKSTFLMGAATAILFSPAVSAHANSVNERPVPLVSSVTSKPLTPLDPAAGGNAYIDIHIQNVKPNSGPVIVEIFATESDYSAQAPIGRVIFDAPDTDVKASFQSLNEGRYAYRVYQDSNRNGRLDTASDPYIYQARAFKNVRAENWTDAEMLLPDGLTIRRSAFPDAGPYEDAPQPQETATTRTAEIYKLLMGG